MWESLGEASGLLAQIPSACISLSLFTLALEGKRGGELIPFHFGVNQGLGRGRDLPEITQHPR